jgi:hypothetical protein
VGDITRNVTWESSNESVATMSATGLATMRAPRADYTPADVGVALWSDAGERCSTWLVRGRSSR